MFLMEADTPTPDILIPLPFERNHWLLNYTTTGKVEEFDEWDILEDFARNAKFLDHYHVLKFGDYEGRTVRQLIELGVVDGIDCFKEYLLHEEFFFVEPSVIRGLLAKGYEFDEPYNYKCKLCDHHACLKMLTDYHNELAAEMEDEDYEEQLDNDNWKSSNTNPYYDDNLDMNQQSQEYWDNL